MDDDKITPKIRNLKGKELIDFFTDKNGNLKSDYIFELYFGFSINSKLPVGNSFICERSIPIKYLKNYDGY